MKVYNLFELLVDQNYKILSHVFDVFSKVSNLQHYKVLSHVFDVFSKVSNPFESLVDQHYKYKVLAVVFDLFAKVSNLF